MQFLSNGVDFERFRGNKDLPEIFKELQRPIVTYAGKMQELFDIELVRSIATSFQSCTFLFIGKIFNKNIKTELFSCKNVIFGGDINYELLPNYICNSDVCIIPYNINNQHGGDPIKFYEYMAAGKPVVSTRIGEIDKYHNGSTIFICCRDDFLPSLDVALSCKDVIKNDLPLDLTWKYKAEYMLERVLNGNHDS